MKRIVLLVLVVMLVMGLCVIATAAEADAHEIKVLEGTATVAFKDAEQKNLTVEITGLPDGQYILLVLKAVIDDNGNYTASGVETENILYINQETAVGGKLSFDNVYPKDIADSVIKIAGTDSNGNTVKKDIALINAAEPAYKLGDVDGNGSVTMTDAMLAARKGANLEITAPVFIEAAADVDGAAGITMTDAMLIARRGANLISSFPNE